MNKYRVWDRKLNGYFSDDLLISCDGDVMTWGVFSVESHDHPEDLIIERYTGLKDKNGVEIYEGDIVYIHDRSIASIHNNGSFEDRVNYACLDYSTCVVEWVDSLAGFSPLNNYDIDCEAYPSQEVFEIIGNIHHNPELLDARAKQ